MDEVAQEEIERAETSGSSTSFGIGSVVNVRKFLQSWDTDVTDLSSPSPERKENAYIANKMGISTDLADELSAVCG